MKITVLVKPNAKKESVTVSDGVYVVRVNAPPVEGAANERVIELLAEHLDRPKSSIQLVHGHRSRRKVFLLS